MPTYLAPAVYVEEKSSGSKPISGVSTSTAAFVGVAEKGPVGRATFVTNFAEFVKRFGNALRVVPGESEYYLYYAVRHFFRQGGTRCYVVRVVSFANVDDAASIEASSAFAEIDGALLDGTVQSAALRIEGINEGEWSESLEVRTLGASAYAHQLAESTASGNAESVLLVENTDVREGSLLHLVEEITAVVDRVVGQNVTVADGVVLTGGAAFTGSINSTVKVFTPDHLLETQTNLSASVAVTSGTAGDVITLDSVEKGNGATLRRGDTLSFVVAEALVAVKKVSSAKTSGGDDAMKVEFDSQALPAMVAANSRAYARNFTVQVRDRDDIVEEHANLSLVPTDLADHVSVRLGGNGDDSQVILAIDQAADELVLIGNTGFASLAGGDDGLPAGDADFIGSDLIKTGIRALDLVDNSSILAVPNATQAVSEDAIAYSERRGDMIYVADRPSSSSDTILDYREKLPGSSYAALYHPWIQVEDYYTGRTLSVPPSGAVAGVYAQSDGKRGVHKAPAGIDVGRLTVARGTAEQITPGANDELYQEEVNAIRNLPEGITVWGARTLSADPEWALVNVRRLFIFLRKSIDEGTQWVVFEPNDRTLWKSIERNVAAFLRIQWNEGKLVGETEEKAFFVRCNEETNPQEVIDAGQVITEIGVAPSKPAEFVIFRIQQFAGGE